ncbi:unnamed protein product, partial [Closterium sp. Yama58-4]
VAAATSDAHLHLLAFHAPSLSWHRLASLHHHSCPVLSLHHLLLPSHPAPSATSPSPAAPTAAPSLPALPRCLITSGATDGAVVLWDVTAPVAHFLHATWRAASHAPPFSPSSLSSTTAASSVAAGGGISGAVRPKAVATVAGRGDQGGASDGEARSEGEEGSEGTGGEEQQQGRAEAQEWAGVDVGPLCVVRGAHQSGVNCIAAAATTVAGRDDWPGQQPRADGGDREDGEDGVDGVEDGGVRGVGAAQVVVVSGGDDEAVHAVVLQLEGMDAEQSTHAARSEGLGAEEGEEGRSIWTDGQAVLSVGLDQRLRCWSLSPNHHAPRGKARGAEAAAGGRCSEEGQRGERGCAGEEGGEGEEGSRLDMGEVACGAGKPGASVNEIREGGLGLRLEGRGRCVVDVPEAEGLAVMGQGTGR